MVKNTKKAKYISDEAKRLAARGKEIIAEAEVDKKAELVRPHTFAEMIGQTRLKENFMDLVKGVKINKRVLGHTLLDGFPGTGKTTLAKVLASELGVKLYSITGSSIQKEAELVPLLNKINRGDILFIDEIHKLKPKIRTFLYPVMEEFKYSYFEKIQGYPYLTEGTVEPFTLIGATTQKGDLEQPFVDRFKNKDRTEIYSVEEMFQIIKRSSKIWQAEISNEAVMEIANRSKFTPRLANDILERVQFYAANKKVKKIDLKIAEEGCRLKGVDKMGLESLDKDYLNTLVKLGGGPAGIDNLAIFLGENAKLLKTTVEPYLLRIGFIYKTTRGRVLTTKAIEYLGLKMDDVLKKNIEAVGGFRYRQEPVVPKTTGSMKEWAAKKLAEKKTTEVEKK